jgi:hypothetical protein
MPSHLRRLNFAILFALGIASPFLGRALAVFAMPARQQEVARVTSPDSRHDAVTIRYQPLLPYMRASVEVYVVPRGGQVAPSADPVLLATRAVGVQSTWKDDRLLEIHYSRARVEGFTAIWPSIANNPPMVEIRLSPLTTGFSFAAEGDS